MDCKRSSYETVCDLGHLARMDGEEWPNKVEAPGRMPRGRPRLRWNDVVKSDTREYI